MLIIVENFQGRHGPLIVSLLVDTILPDLLDDKGHFVRKYTCAVNPFMRNKLLSSYAKSDDPLLSNH